MLFAAAQSLCILLPVFGNGLGIAMMSRLLTRREQLVLGFLAASLLIGSITVYALRGNTGTPAEIVVDPAPDVVPAVQPATSQPAAPSREIVVSIQGGIVKPGVYTVDEGGRVHDLIQMAGGLTPSADTSSLNLAARLVDGTTLTIPLRNTSESTGSGVKLTPQNPDAYSVLGQASAVSGAASGGAAGGLIDLNLATQAQLETLPGIGPKLAQQIIQYRESQPFRDVSDLDNVSGIGPAKLEAVREFVTVE